jgi:hypothetical protein
MVFGKIINNKSLSVAISWNLLLAGSDLNGKFRSVLGFIIKSNNYNKYFKVF